MATNDTLVGAARRIVAASDPTDKIAMALETQRLWADGALSLGLKTAGRMPERPGRPEKPILTTPRKVPKRGIDTVAGRIALLHAIAHIELNAIDMAWDIIGRFTATPVPGSFFDDWIKVGAEEATHFARLSSRLNELGASYGDLPAHDGLWQAANETADDLLARLAIVPLVLEARGLDVTPSMIDRLMSAGDHPSAEILKTIYEDELGHVAIGFRWFRFLCLRNNLPLEATYQSLVRKHFKGAVKPPFNEEARSAAGLTATFYKPLAI